MVHLAYLPVVPLRRGRVRNHTDFEAEQIRTLPQAARALAALGGGGVTWTEDVEVLERTPLDAGEVLSTYLRSYVLVPLLILWPIWVARFVLSLLPDPEAAPKPVLVAAIALGLTNALVVLSVAVGRMRRGPSPRRPALSPRPDR